LAPIAVVGSAGVAVSLAERLRLRSDEELSRICGAYGGELLVLIADDPALLPWADGAVYLGRDPAAPALLLPTLYLPNVPLPLFEQALRRRFPQTVPPLAILPDQGIVLPIGETVRPVDRARLELWRKEAA
jgi:hypothetical protein